MLKSMTGFGRGEVITQDEDIIVEIKTLNHRFLDINCHIPSAFLIFEHKIRENIQKKLLRGKINVYINYYAKGKKDDEIFFNIKLAKKYGMFLKKLKKELKEENDIGFSDILSLPGVIGQRHHNSQIQNNWLLIKKALNIAINKVEEIRLQEGEILDKDIFNRVKNIDKQIIFIKKRVPIMINTYRKRFKNRIKNLPKDILIDRSKIETEVGIYARSCDITEEITRLGSHIANFYTTLKEKGSVGRKMDFIAQEMHREVNTIASKADDFKITEKIIQIKSEIEKIREQVQNVE